MSSLVIKTKGEASNQANNVRSVGMDNWQAEDAVLVGG
jgi:hypothetical protein